MNIKQSGIAAAAIIGMIVIPASSFAATYEYVTRSGTLASVTANSAQEAVNGAADIAPNSGVLLVNTNTTQTTQTTQSTMPAQMPAMSMPSGTDTKAAGLRVLLNALNREHANLASETLRGVYDANPSTTASAKSLDDNSVALSKSIEAVYGQAAGDKFLEIWRSHITFFVAYSTAARNKDQAGKDKAVADLANYVDRISEFLSSANPNLPYDAVHQVVSTHVGLLKSTIDNHFSGNFDASHTQQRATDAQIGTGVADTVAGAIVKQFPSQF